LKTLLFLASLLLAGASQAAIDSTLLAPLTGDDPDARVEAIGKIGALANDDATRLLVALKNGDLYATPDGHVLIVTDDKAYNPATGATGSLPEGIDGVMVNNRLRGAVDDALSALKLFSPDRAQRLAAVTELQKSVTLAQAPLIDKALARESDAEIRPLLQLVAATANLQSPDAGKRKAAVEALAASSNANLRPVLQAMLTDNPDGTHAEPDEGVRVAAAHTLNALDSRLARTEFIGNVFYGVSLGSVLLLTALGLAITFGLMGIINMAHGELLMIGAYTTYLCQTAFRNYLPAAIDGICWPRCRPHSSSRRCRHRAGTHGHPLALRPSAGDATGHLGHQPDTDAGRAHHLRRAERRSGQPEPG
jgi:urea transport system permease protein